MDVIHSTLSRKLSFEFKGTYIFPKKRPASDQN